MAEDREKEEMGLGELPEDLFKIKGDSYPEDDLFYPSSLPADLGSSAPLADAPQVNEDRSRGASVRSTFDTRPINGTDFHFTETQEVTPVDEADVIALFNYTVPDSFVAVLRSFEFRQYPEIMQNSITPRVSILINGITQVGHSNLEMVGDATPQPTHIIAAEKSILTLRIIYPATYSSGIQLSVWVHLYGNLLLTRNQPAAFEVGNETPVVPIPIPAGIGGNETVPSAVPSQQMPPQPTRRQLPKFSKTGNRQKRAAGRLSLPPGVKRRF